MEEWEMFHVKHLKIKNEPMESAYHSPVSFANTPQFLGAKER